MGDLDLGEQGHGAVVDELHHAPADSRRPWQKYQLAAAAGRPESYLFARPTDQSSGEPQDTGESARKKNGGAF